MFIYDSLNLNLDPNRKPGNQHRKLKYLQTHCINFGKI